MFSLRRDQFRAILFGILIADALSHRQISWGSSLPSSHPPPPNTTVESIPAALASDQWCQQITQSLNRLIRDRTQHPIAQPWPSEITPHQESPMQKGIVSLLCDFPRLIQSLAFDAAAAFVDPATSTVLVADTTDQTAVRAFYRGATTLLSGQRAALASIQLASPQIAHSSSATLVQVVALALEQVYLAEGDFALTLAQSLKSSPNIPGLPILSGFLSTCWVGSRGIPTRWPQQLLTPTPPLQYWLQRRWHIDDVIILYEWGEYLHDRWLGQYPNSS